MDTLTTSDRTERIRRLNDTLRRSFITGKVMITSGVEAFGPDLVAEITARVRGYDDFTPDNDPYGEHDFGSFEIAGIRVFWKIDYYDKTLEFGSPDPADPRVTTRVLTIMRAEEW